MVKASATQSVDLGSITGRVIPINFKTWYSQLPCLTLSIKRTVWRFHLKVVDRWQLDSKTERSLRCLHPGQGHLANKQAESKAEA